MHALRTFFGDTPAQLRLRHLPDLHAVKLCFDTMPTPVDSGPAAAIATTIAQALCARYAITFLGPLGDEPASKPWQFHDGYATQTQSRWLASKVPLVWTRQVHIASQAFETSWSTEGQIILLSESDRPVEFDAFSLVQPDDAQISGLLKQSDFCGVLLPGVDGCFATLGMQDESRLMQFLLHDLPNPCAKHQVQLFAAESAQAFYINSRSVNASSGLKSRRLGCLAFALHL
jgi:hypothetical protein